MAMGKKDYEMIADRLFLLVDANGENGTSRDIALLRQTVFELSSAFMADNPRFDPDKFTRACGF